MPATSMAAAAIVASVILSSPQPCSCPCACVCPCIPCPIPCPAWLACENSLCAKEMALFQGCSLDRQCLAVMAWSTVWKVTKANRRVPLRCETSLRPSSCPNFSNSLISCTSDRLAGTLPTCRQRVAFAAPPPALGDRLSYEPPMPIAFPFFRSRRSSPAPSPPIGLPSPPGTKVLKPAPPGTGELMRDPPLAPAGPPSDEMSVTLSFLGMRSTRKSDDCFSSRANRPPQRSRIRPSASVPTLARRVLASSTALSEPSAAPERISWQVRSTVVSTDSCSPGSEGEPPLPKGEDWCSLPAPIPMPAAGPPPKAPGYSWAFPMRGPPMPPMSRW
mmetsp:Transcript_20468/g.45533  ORF Transcript_20468/g.45533 Transcript_20468/m.45533 type:complete len:332 (-) Transcript_20468:1162-2157(-)